MRERSRFESELGYLGLREAYDFDQNQDFIDWQKRGKRLHVDLYDRSNAHLQYLGRIILRSTDDRWEKRLINRSDLEAIYTANSVKTADRLSRRLLLFRAEVETEARQLGSG